MAGARPRAVVEFELCFIAGLLLAIGNLIVNWHLFFGTPDAFLWERFHPWFLPTYVGVIYGFYALLGYLTARRAMRVAKWAVIVWDVFCAGLGVAGIWTHSFKPGLAGVIQIVVIVLNLVAVARLFDPAARRWFRGEREVAEIAADFV